MTNVQTRIKVDSRHRISGVAPATVPAGEHEAIITIVPDRQAEIRLRVDDLPLHDLTWDGSVSLHREDIYGHDGR
jgi:hypothetical protein